MKMDTLAHEAYHRGRNLVTQGDYGNAEREFRNALTYANECPEIHADLAYCMDKEGKLYDAIVEKTIALRLSTNPCLIHDEPITEVIKQDLIRLIKKNDIRIIGIEFDTDEFVRKYQRYCEIVREKTSRYKGYFPMTWRFCSPKREEFFEPVYLNVEPYITESGSQTVLIKLEISIRVLAKWAHVYEVDDKLACLILDAFLDTEYTKAEYQALLEYPEFRENGSLIVKDRMIRRSDLPEMGTRWFAGLMWFLSIYCNPMYIIESDKEDWLNAQMAAAMKSHKEADTYTATNLQAEILNIEKEFKNRVAERGFDSSWGFITS
jgi:hypothetical protein